MAQVNGSGKPGVPKGLGKRASGQKKSLRITSLFSVPSLGASKGRYRRHTIAYRYGRAGSYKEKETPLVTVRKVRWGFQEKSWESTAAAAGGKDGGKDGVTARADVHRCVMPCEVGREGKTGARLLTGSGSTPLLLEEWNNEGLGGEGKLPARSN